MQAPVRRLHRHEGGDVVAGSVLPILAGLSGRRFHIRCTVEARLQHSLASSQALLTPAGGRGFRAFSLQPGAWLPARGRGFDSRPQLGSPFPSDF